jgi:serine/threonine-protein kinase HipA
MTAPLGVYVDIDGQTRRAGIAYLNRRGTTITTAFEYERDCLAGAGQFTYALDPALPLYAGSHVVAGLPGAFADCAPDKWGRNLIAIRLRAEAVQQGRTPPTVGEADYLLGVSDFTRQGALRFTCGDDGQFLASDTAVPKLVELPRLLRASDAVAADSDDLAEMKPLLEAGAGTLGGARPKASVRDGARLLIAKFPKPADAWDVLAWEATALELARRAGVDVPAHRLIKVDGRGCLLLDRFDRNVGQRVGYMSAMTLTSGQDGQPGDYVEVAETLTEYGSNVDRDLKQLWRRAAFSVAIHNTDDHLRNHGLLRDRVGWRLSPAFDINPNPDIAEQRVTAIGGAVSVSDELDGLMLNAPSFGLTSRQAVAILTDVLAATREWRHVAIDNGVPVNQADRFADAFSPIRTRVPSLTSGPASARTARRTGPQQRDTTPPPAPSPPGLAM